jgi:hypothetical protein
MEAATSFASRLGVLAEYVLRSVPIIEPLEECPTPWLPFLNSRGPEASGPKVQKHGERYPYEDGTDYEDES